MCSLHKQFMYSVFRIKMLLCIQLTRYANAFISYSPPVHTLTDDKSPPFLHPALSPGYVSVLFSKQSSKLLNNHIDIHGRFPYFLRPNNETNSSNISTKSFQYLLSRSPSLSIELKTTAVTDTASLPKSLSVLSVSYKRIHITKNFHRNK